MGYRQDVIVAMSGTSVTAQRTDTSSHVGSDMHGVAIVAPHNLVRGGLETLIASSASSRVVASVAGPEELDVSVTRPDVIVLDMSGRIDAAEVEVLTDLARRGRVLVLLDEPGGRALIDLVRAGAHGCVCARAEAGEVLQAVDAVARGSFHVSPGLCARWSDELRRPGLSVAPVLGRRETETLRWLAAGLTHRQVANRMGLTETTVSTYVKRIRGKLNVGNKADLTRMAIEWGLLDEPAASTRPTADAMSSLRQAAETSRWRTAGPLLRPVG